MTLDKIYVGYYSIGMALAPRISYQNGCQDRICSINGEGHGVKLGIHSQFRNRNRGSLQLSNSHPGAGVRPFRLLFRSFLAVTALLCLLGPVRSLALDPAKNVYQYNCQSWTRREDLPANSINAITQTKDGYLWFPAQPKEKS